MPDLILHIGLGKCGSSTLQRNVFQHEAGYLGTAPGFDDNVNFAKQLQQCTPFAGRQTISRRGLRQWVQTVLEFKTKQWPDLDRLILSNEMLSAASRIEDRPILSVLSELRDGLWPGRVKVVLVLRNQAARIASNYAQGSATNTSAGQDDFERYVVNIMNRPRNRRLFDYASLVDGLRKVLDDRNICVLLIEETGSSEFWAELADFCQMRCFDPANFSKTSSEKKNKRSLSGQRWQISPFDPEQSAKRRIDLWLNLLWSKRLMTRSRGRVRSYAA